jgi:hypothetical protein
MKRPGEEQGSSIRADEHSCRRAFVQINTTYQCNSQKIPTQAKQRARTVHVRTSHKVHTANKKIITQSRRQKVPCGTVQWRATRHLRHTSTRMETTRTRTHTNTHTPTHTHQHTYLYVVQLFLQWAITAGENTHEANERLSVTRTQLRTGKGGSAPLSKPSCILHDK